MRPLLIGVALAVVSGLWLWGSTVSRYRDALALCDQSGAAGAPHIRALEQRRPGLVATLVPEPDRIRGANCQRAAAIEGDLDAVRDLTRDAEILLTR